MALKVFATDLVKMEKSHRLEEGGGDRRILLGGEHKLHLRFTVKRGIVPRSLNKQAHFRTLRAGKVPEESGYLVRDFLLGERWEMDIGPMNSFAEFQAGFGPCNTVPRS